MRTHPKTIAKAARLGVARRTDGTFDVAGDTGTYRVRPSSSRGIAYYCDCQAARSGSRCSHVLAVTFHLNSAPSESRPA